MPAVRDGLFRDEPVTVLGFARSGIALARFLVDAGARVTIYDGRPADALSGAIDALEGRSATFALGPDVDPASAWAGAALVTTSPAINPDYPTTEPRLRAALRALVDARAGGDAAAPAVISEPDLFLRLCVAPDRGPDRDQGQDHHRVAHRGDPRGGPEPPGGAGREHRRADRRTAARADADHRVVYELSELQLPTLSRGTTVAVYTNVTSDHLDRHGSLERYRLAKRRLAELVDPAGALVLNAEDPWSPRMRTLRPRRWSGTGADGPRRRRGPRRWLDRGRRRRRPWRSPGPGPAPPPTSLTARSCRSPSWGSPVTTTSATPSPPSRSARYSVCRPRPSGPRPPASMASNTGSRPWPSSTASASSTTRRGRNRTR